MKYPVIDAHVHPFTDSCGKNIGRYGHPRSTAEFMETLQLLGVSNCCGSVIGAADPLDFKTLLRFNETALELREKYPDFYVPGIHIHGGYPDECCRMLRDYHRAGVRWIGEMVNYSMATGPYDSPGMLKICETARELGMVLNLHVNMPELGQLENLAVRLPGLKIVLAHPGDGADFEKRLALLCRYPDLYLDISGTGLFRWGMLRKAVDTLGADHVIFGSDFPVCNPGLYLHGALFEHLTEAEFKLVLAENFLRLTGN